VRDDGILEALHRIEPGGILRFRLAQVPLDELLLAVHESRFTGAISIGEYPADQIYMREGAVVGMTPKKHVDAQLLGQVLLQQKSIEKSTLDAILQDDHAENGMLLGQRLLSKRLIDTQALDRACTEQGRRRLFHLYDYEDAPALVSQGIGRLANFHPAYVDVRPVIAYGMVVRASPARKRDVLDRVRNRWVKLRAPYDESRNSYGLPPPVLAAVRSLSGGEVGFGDEPTLQGLGPEETSGVLLLFDRMSLLEIVR
jgi:uncharacterized protein DUF4388